MIGSWLIVFMIDKLIKEVFDRDSSTKIWYVLDKTFKIVSLARIFNINMSLVMSGNVL